MKCYICNYDDAEQDGTNNKVIQDPKQKGRFVCQACLDESWSAVLEFSTDEISEEYKLKHHWPDKLGEKKKRGSSCCRNISPSLRRENSSMDTEDAPHQGRWVFPMVGNDCV